MFKTTERVEKLIAARQKQTPGENIISAIDNLMIGWGERNNKELDKEPEAIKVRRLIRSSKMVSADYHELGRLMECYKYILTYKVFYRLLEYEDKITSEGGMPV